MGNRQSRAAIHFALVPFLAVPFGIARASDAHASTTDYSIASLEYALTPMEQVGRVQAGLLCLPKGKLRWRDVARPPDDVMTRRLERVLRDRGMTVAPQPDPLFGDLPPPTRYRIKIVVDALSMRLCVPGLGIGEKAPSGSGRLTVRWETWDREARTLAASQRYDVPIAIARRDARTASSVISDAVVETAMRYAAESSR
ncbi:MAG: hypothetical protein ACKVOP_08450 [Sphingomonadaceae bacterium]